MKQIPFHLFDVFTATKYGGNYLSVFIDYEDLASEIAREWGFEEVTFINEKLQQSKIQSSYFYSRI